MWLLNTLLVGCWYVCDFGVGIWHLICAPIKVLAEMDLAQCLLPQCGRINQDGCDFRVSSHPTIYGENLVLRVMGRVVNIKAHKTHSGFVDSVTHKAGGLVLVVGPVGSGKTTTILDLLGYMAARGRNVMSLENPVERIVTGVRQSSVDDEGFVSGLKSILRQNPDVVFIGEIRDAEVAVITF